MKRINHAELEQVAYHYQKLNKSMIVVGRTGIGKSMSFKNAAKRIAQEKNKSFVEWNDISTEKKREVIEKANIYYVFVDLRLTQMAPEDLKGLPKMSEGVVEWLPNMWAKALSLSEGMVIFDEINLAPPSLQATVYQILLDRQIGELPLNKGVFVVGAGNLTEDRAGVYEMPKPVRTRAGVFELKIPTKEEFTDYAIKSKMDARVISYINKFPSRIFVENEKTDDVICPRGWETVSTVIMGLDSKKELGDIALYSSGVLGEAGSIEFEAFIKLAENIPTPEAMLSGKAKIPKETDLKYACIAAITEYYRQHEKERKDNIKKVIDLKKSIDPEFYILMLRMCKAIQPDCLKQLLGTKEFDQIREYAEFLTEDK